MALFAQVAELAEQMAATASKLAKRAAIAAALGEVQAESPDEVALFCLYLAGLPFAESDARKLNAGGALLSKALLKVSGATEAALREAYRHHGDMGSAAFDLLVGGVARPTHDGDAVVDGAPTLSEVAAAFAGMASARTTAIRASLVEDLLRRASALEAKYLLKLMLGDMRIGVKESLVEEAIAAAAGAEVAAVRHAVMLEADLGGAAVRAFAGALGEARMRLFHPLGFMLASPVETPEEAIERFTPKTAAEEPAVVHAFLEDKFDGMRAQVHFGSAAEPGRVAIYSRNREDITESFPELVEAFSAAGELGAGVILDGEILGWDFGTAQALPFAVMGQRIGRKRVGNDIRRQVPVIFMAFDLMFAEDELQLGRPLRERRNRLEALVEELVERTVSPLELSERQLRSQAMQASLLFDSEPEPEKLPRLLLSPARLVESAEEIDRAYLDARARANEGVMLKAADSMYQPGRRGLAWVKLKRELATLDVVITGAEYGHGRKAGLLSDYTFAIRGPEGDLLNVGKAYSGTTDAEIAELTEFLKAHTLEDNGYFRTVEPLIVLEVAFNNIMRSDRHASGFALRFPRILHIRRDKPIEEIDTLERVEAIYQSQVDKPAEEIVSQPRSRTDLKVKKILDE
jgi:DNA ligase-1